jgi:coproporphyrinogen III oxidase-like Fe-S oxidoreductase
MNSEKDNHYSFSDKDSNIPIKEILELFPEDAEITIETNPDIKKTQEDLRIIRKIISEIT